MREGKMSVLKCPFCLQRNLGSGRGVRLNQFSAYPRTRRGLVVDADFELMTMETVPPKPWPDGRIKMLALKSGNHGFIKRSSK